MVNTKPLPQTLKLGLIPIMYLPKTIQFCASYTLSVWALNQEILVDKEWLVNLSPNRNKAHIRGLLTIGFPYEPWHAVYQHCFDRCTESVSWAEISRVALKVS